MGLPSLVVSEEMIEELPSVLSDVCEVQQMRRPPSPTSEEVYCGTIDCIGFDDSVVQLHILRNERLERDQVVLVMQPASSGLAPSKSTKTLMRNIDVILRERGAKDSRTAFRGQDQETRARKKSWWRA